MGGGLAIVFLTMLVGRGIYGLTSGARASNRERAALAQRLGLAFETAIGFRSPNMFGWLDDVEVDVVWGQDDSHGPSPLGTSAQTRYLVRGFPKSLELLPRRKRRNPRPIGDESFDDSVFLAGDLAAAAPLLSAALRARASELVALGGSVTNGDLVLWVPGYEPPKSVEARLAWLFHLAKDYHAARGDLARTATVAVESSVGAAFALEVLLDLHPGTPALHAAAERASHDDDGTTRALAALALEDEPGLHAALAGGDVTPPTIARTVAWLCADDVRRATWLDATLEPALLELVAAEDAAVVRLGAEALADVGTLAAIAPLTTVAKKTFGDRAAKEAAREAIDAIRARHPGGGLGQLSLAPLDDAGALSIAPTAASAGSLALAPADERGSLSTVPAEDGGEGAPRG